MTFGRSLERHLEHYNLPTAFTEWVTFAQDRAAWKKLVTQPPFVIGKQYGDQGATPGWHRETGDDTWRYAPPRYRSGQLPSTPTPIRSTHKQNHEQFPLGGARKHPSNCLHRSSGALHYTPAGGAPPKRNLAIPSRPLTTTETYYANTQAHCTYRACLNHPPAT